MSDINLGKILSHYCFKWGLQGALVVKNLPANARRHKRLRFDPWVGKIPCGGAWQPTPVSLHEESPRTEELAGYSLWGRKE